MINIYKKYWDLTEIMQKDPNDSESLQSFWYLTEELGRGWAAGAMLANLPCSISAVF